MERNDSAPFLLAKAAAPSCKKYIANTRRLDETEIAAFVDAVDRARHAKAGPSHARSIEFDQDCEEVRATRCALSFADGRKEGVSIGYRAAGRKA